MAFWEEGWLMEKDCCDEGRDCCEADIICGGGCMLMLPLLFGLPPRALFGSWVCGFAAEGGGGAAGRGPAALPEKDARWE